MVFCSVKMICLHVDLLVSILYNALSLQDFLLLFIIHFVKFLVITSENIVSSPFPLPSSAGISIARMLYFLKLYHSN